MTPAQFVARVKKSGAPAAALLIGPEAYDRRRVKDALVALFPEGSMAEHDLIETRLSEIVDDARSLSLFASERQVWVSNAEAALPRGKAAAAEEEEGEGAPGDASVLADYLKDPTPGVALRTWSYAGGTNAAGQTIARGGFEPYLNLYMADGTQMNPGQSGGCAGGLALDPITKVCGDVYYPTTLSFPGGVWDAGTYTVVLSTFANPGVGNLSDGFFAPAVLGLNGPSNFTCQVGSPGYQGNPPTIGVDQPFCDEFLPGTERTGNWALDILNVDSATEAPEPGSAGLGVLGGAASFSPALTPQIEVGYRWTDWGRVGANAFGFGTSPHNDGNSGRVSLNPRFIGASLTVFGRPWHRLQPALEVGGGEFWISVRGEAQSANVGQGQTSTLSSPGANLSVGLAVNILPYLTLELRGGTLWLQSKALIYSTGDTYLGSMGRPMWLGSARLGTSF